MSELSGIAERIRMQWRAETRVAQVFQVFVPREEAVMTNKFRFGFAGTVAFTLLLATLVACGPEPFGTETPEPRSLQGSTLLQSVLPTPTTTPLPIPPGPDPTKVPLCTPPALGGTQPDEDSASRTFVFSDPQIVLTDTAAIEIAGWMPDSKKLLLVRDIPSQGQQAIETLDTDTGLVVRYADTNTSAGDVFPLFDGPAIGFLARDPTREMRVFPGTDLMISHGPGQVQLIMHEVSTRRMSVDPSSASLVLYTRVPGGPDALPLEAYRDFRVFIVPGNPYYWKYPRYFADRVETGYLGDEFQTAVRPDGSLIAFYADPFLFLYDPTTETVCEVDLGIFQSGDPYFVWNARWSPDGRYLAMLTSARFPGQLLDFIDLIVLDSYTGQLRTINPSALRMVSSFAWSPTGGWLIVLAQEDREDLPNSLHLVDAATGNVRSILPGFRFGTTGSGGLSWDPNPAMIALACHAWDAERRFLAEYRVCAIEVVLQQ